MLNIYLINIAIINLLVLGSILWQSYKDEEFWQIIAEHLLGFLKHRANIGISAVVATAVTYLFEGVYYILIIQSSNLILMNIFAGFLLLLEGIAVVCFCLMVYNLNFWRVIIPRLKFEWAVHVIKGLFIIETSVAVGVLIRFL